MVIEVSREQVLAYRIAAQQLHGTALPPAELAVTALGVQDTPVGTARLAVSARTSAPLSDDDPDLALVWSARGAPHLHRRADLAALAAALWPLNDADARSRIASPKIKEGAKLGLAAFTATAEAIADVVTGPTRKGDLSTAVSARIPASLTFWCEPCGAQHLSGLLFQQAGLPGGAELRRGASSTTLVPIPGRPGVPERAAGTADLARIFLGLLGPATDTETANFLGTTRTHLRTVWPTDLTEVATDGVSGWLPTELVDALLDPPTPPALRLLPAGDPFLQTRNRHLLVPDAARHKEVWKVLGNPGVVLADGEITGTWRAKLARDRLDVTVTPFGGRADQRALTGEAERIAAARGVTDVRLLVSG